MIPILNTSLYQDITVSRNLKSRNYTTLENLQNAESEKVFLFTHNGKSQLSFSNQTILITENFQFLNLSISDLLAKKFVVGIVLCILGCL